MDKSSLLRRLALKVDKVRMHLAHPPDEPLDGVTLVELPNGLGRELPRPVHPEVLNLHSLHHLDEASRVVVVGMRQHHVVDEEVTPVVRSDVFDDLLAGPGVSPVYDMDENAPLGVRGVLNADRVCIAITNGQKVDLKHCSPRSCAAVGP
jgi:hypothetical protein